MSQRHRTLVIAVFLVLVSMLVYPGYPFDYTSDQLLYFPAIFKSTHPGLYPTDPVANWTPVTTVSLFDEVLVGLHRATGLDYRVLMVPPYFLVRLLGLLFVVRLAESVSRVPWIRWVLLVTLAVPIWVYGTATLTFNPYLAPRLLSFVFALGSVAYYCGGRGKLSLLTLLVGALFHPVPVVPVILFLGLEAIHLRQPRVGLGAGLALLVVFGLQFSSSGERLLPSLLVPYEDLDLLSSLGHFRLSTWVHPVFVARLVLEASLASVLGFSLYPGASRALKRFLRFLGTVGLIVVVHGLMVEWVPLGIVRAQLYRILRYLVLGLPLLVSVYVHRHRNHSSGYFVVGLFLLAGITNYSVRGVGHLLACLFAFLLLFEPARDRLPDPWLSTRGIRRVGLATALLSGGFLYFLVSFFGIGSILYPILVPGGLAVVSLLATSTGPPFVPGSNVVRWVAVLNLVLVGVGMTLLHRWEPSPLESHCRTLRRTTPVDARIHPVPIRHPGSDQVRVHCRRDVLFSSSKPLSIAVLSEPFREIWLFRRRQWKTNTLPPADVRMTVVPPITVHFMGQNPSPVDPRPPRGRNPQGVPNPSPTE